MDIRVDVRKCRIPEEALKEGRARADGVLERLWSGEEEFTGWVRLPMEFDRDELERILRTAERIREQCRLLVVIGIGGSYLGTRAVLHALAGRSVPGCPEIRYAGHHLSGTAHAELLEEMEEKDTCLCVISKSGTTTESSIAFGILKDAMIRKYGPEAASARIYAVTDREKGILRQEVREEGYAAFDVPENIGGRYSVLTAVGLLPLAAAGVDIRELLRGAEAMAGDPLWDDEAVDYGVARYQLMNAGKAVEVFEYYEPQLRYLAEWLKQLFGESEGKEGKGLFPASLQLTSDLHSMGQFLQEGSPIVFETVLNVLRPDADLEIPPSAGALLAGKTMNQVNRIAVEAVIAAHEAAGVPVIRIDIPQLTAYYLGQLIYFFETTCAITAGLMGVNAFDQPGVEAYKAEMRRLLSEE